jgi:hypothetical protein
LAAANSVIICVIGLRTSQSGFIAANLFCLAIYGYNLIQWRSQDRPQPSSQPAISDTLTAVRAYAPHGTPLVRTRAVSNDESLRNRDRVPPRRLRRGRKSHASF